MAKNPLFELSEAGTSVWLDYIRRSLITSGELQRMTEEGLPAIEQCIADGVNINITLMFSVKVYEDVARAYIRGLQRRAKAGKPVDIASVASFFVSRVDTSVDKLLEQKIAAAGDPAERQRLQNLLGPAAVANATLAYRAFQRISNDPEFAELRRQG